MWDLKFRSGYIVKALVREVDNWLTLLCLTNIECYIVEFHADSQVMTH